MGVSSSSKAPLSPVFTKVKAEIQLMEAVELGDLQAVKMSVESVKADINCLVRRDNGMELTPLMLASSLTVIVDANDLPLRDYPAAHLEIMHYLVKSGADVDKVNDQGLTAVYFAASNGHTERVDCLLLYGADKNKAAKNGETPLWIAAFEGHFKVVTALLNDGADKDKANNNGTTPLYVAARKGHLAVVRLLLQHGADKNKANNNGYTPLHIATLNNRLDVVQYLVEDPEVDVDKKTTKASGFLALTTPLHIAVEIGYTKIAVCLLERGADLNARTANGRLPLDLACSNKMRQILINEDKCRRDLSAIKRTASSEPVEEPISKRTRRSCGQKG